MNAGGFETLLLKVAIELSEGALRASLLLPLSGPLAAEVVRKGVAWCAAKYGSSWVMTMFTLNELPCYDPANIPYKIAVLAEAAVSRLCSKGESASPAPS